MNSSSTSIANSNAPKSGLSYPTKVLLTVTAVSLLVNYVETMVIPGIPTIQADLSTTATVASWITSAFLIVGAAVSPLFGKLGDIYGKKKIFLTVLLFYIAGVGLAGFSSNIYMLITSRAIQGIGFAIIPLGIAIVTDIFPKERVATAQGIISGTFAIGAAAGLIIGAYVVQDLSWQWAFHTAFILSIIMFFVVAVMLRKDVPGEKSKVDFTGAAILMSGIVLVLVYLTEAPTLGWLSYENIAFLVPGIILTVSFFVFENKRTSPLIQLKLLKIRNVLVANLVGILASLSMFLLFFAVIYYAQYPKPYGLGLDIITTGLTLAPATLVMLIVGPVIGRLVTKIGPKPILILGASISIIGLLLFTFLQSNHHRLNVRRCGFAHWSRVPDYTDSKHDFGISAQRKHSRRPRNEHHATKPRRRHRSSPRHHHYGHLQRKSKTTCPAVPSPSGHPTAFNTIFATGIALMIVIIAISLTIKNYTFTKNSNKNPENIETQN